MRSIDLNCDVGESDDSDRLVVEERVLAYVTSISIACGGHAGSPSLMRRLLRSAKARGVAVGAHPGYPDRESLGRREVQMTGQALEFLIASQVGALLDLAEEEGVPVAHVKPHGALYNQAARDFALASALVRAVASLRTRLLLVGLAGSRVIEAARARGVAVVEEGFADRAYRRDGTLVPRTEPGALIADEAEVAARAVRLARDGLVVTADGTDLVREVETLCVHADTPGADRLVARIRRALEEAALRVVAPGPATEE